MEDATTPGVAGDEPAWSGFEGTTEERIRRLQLENDILRGVVEVLKAGGLDALSNREKTPAVERPRQIAGHGLREPAASLRISKSSFECQRASLARRDKYAGVRKRVAGVFEAGGRARGYRWAAHELRRLEEPVVVSEKVVRRIMREEGCRVTCLRRARRYSSYAGEASSAPGNLARRDFHADVPNGPRLSDITEFGLPCGK